MRPFALLGITCLSVVLAACNGKGADRDLVTDKGDAELTQSIELAAKDMSQTEKDAFLWALGSISLAEVAQLYPNESPRTIYRAVANKIVDETPEKIAALEAVKPKFDKVLAELNMIDAKATGFALESSFHGLQPTIKAKVSNGSALDVSMLRWRAELYIDEQEKPAAVAILTDSYNTSGRSLFGQQAPAPGGLRAGQAAERSFTVGFVTGDPAWTTLAIQNARSRRVVIVPIVASVTDFNSQAYLAGAPYEELESLKEKVAVARKVAAL